MQSYTTYATDWLRPEGINYCSLGKVHSWNFSCEKNFMLKYFHLLG